MRSSAMPRRLLSLLLAFAGCNSGQSMTYDLEPILLARAPTMPGGQTLGGLLAQVDTSLGLMPLLVDTAFPFNSFVSTGCPSSAPPGWTYVGSLDVRDGLLPNAPLRAAFGNVGLIGRCPGPTGDAATQAAGVFGSPLLANFTVDLVLPRDPAAPASMTLWPGLPGTDDQLASDGWVSLHYDPRGGAVVAKENGESAVTLPNSRIVLAACAGAPAFSASGPHELCAQGEFAVKTRGADLLLALGTGEGPLILSQSAWHRIAASLDTTADAGSTGSLYTPFSTTATPARFITLPSLALFQGTVDSSWIGGCAELARARRIEWVLANQDKGACFQPCDASRGQPLSTHPYLEVGGQLDVAVVDETSTIIQALNVDLGAKPQVDGIIGAATLAGTRLRLDYTAQPPGRVVAACLDPSDRNKCFAAPSCPGLGAQDPPRVCFGALPPHWAPVCPSL